jgi:hypothetical protein
VRDKVAALIEAIANMFSEIRLDDAFENGVLKLDYQVAGYINFLFIQQ